MTRDELEHAIRAACDIAGDDQVYVFGSQAILGQFPDAPAALRQSAEADISPVTAVDNVELIDVFLGELSDFHIAFGFYVHGVPIDAAVLPQDWHDRAIRVQNENTRNLTGWCVEAHDLAASKLVAFRDKDRDFVRVLIVEGLIDPAQLLERIKLLLHHPRVTPQLMDTIKQWIGGIQKDRDGTRRAHLQRTDVP
jgi:hypothetical protein